MNQQAGLVAGADEEESAEEVEEDKNQKVSHYSVKTVFLQIYDFSEKDLVNLRRTIYLVIMSSVDYEECCHKLLKLNIREG